MGSVRISLRRRMGVRIRSALAAAAVVAVASVLTGVAFVVAARIFLTGNVDQAASQRAAQVAGALTSTGGTGSTRGTGATDALDAVLRPSPRDRTVVQVLDAHGAVLAASAAIRTAGPISPLRPRAGQTEREQRRIEAARDNWFRVAAVGVQTSGGVRTVLVAQSLDEIDDGTEAAIAALAIGLPVLTLVVGTATFIFVGRSLRPVDAMRRQADTITAQNLHTRLPVPQATDEVAALAATMNTMLDRIEAAAAAQRRFVGDASHELRSPLATIHAGLDLIDKPDLPAASARQVRRMRMESERMARLVADLLMLARLDESGLQRRRQEVDLDDLVYLERERLAAAHPELAVRVEVEPVRVDGDPHQLQRALRNLLDNAARHATATVGITLTPGELTVADDGPGIAPADRERVFERFVRLDDDRSRTGGGSGLGLAIARDIVTAHGGTLLIDDAPGGGALLRLRLPPGPTCPAAP